MKSAKLDSKYRITMPKQIREAMEVKVGDQLVFVKKQGTVYLLADNKFNHEKNKFKGL